MVKIFINQLQLCEKTANNYEEIVKSVLQSTLLQPEEFYLLHNGKRLSSEDQNALLDSAAIHCCLRTNGGKGGFGSMLRAIGAQIEKTTNREACRDLSGRRLRDINEEKRLKAWLEKQSEREREAEEKKKRKIQKLLAVPKHEFKDEEYEEARSKLAEKVSDAVEEGFKKAQAKIATDDEKPESSASKRKTEIKTSIAAKKKKTALWIGDDISDGDSDSSESETEAETTKKAITSY